jgi:hypothetical protein
MDNGERMRITLDVDQDPRTTFRFEGFEYRDMFFNVFFKLPIFLRLTGSRDSNILAGRRLAEYFVFPFLFLVFIELMTSFILVIQFLFTTTKFDSLLGFPSASLGEG